MADVRDPQTPEAVAFALTEKVLGAVKLPGTDLRAAILDLYAECLEATRGQRIPGRQPGHSDIQIEGYNPSSPPAGY